jgi:antitoxin component of MazEF toxin-antitoxin module
VAVAKLKKTFLLNWAPQVQQASPQTRILGSLPGPTLCMRLTRISTRPTRIDPCVITCYNSLVKCTIRRIGNSLGVLLPKPLLTAWGVGEGDSLELTERGIRPRTRAGFSHDELDELKRAIAFAVVRRFTPTEIRAQTLANLHRWKGQGAWVTAYDEWQKLASSNDDGALYSAMLGRDEEAVRLRQSMPFVGLLSAQEVRRLHEEAAG